MTEARGNPPRDITFARRRSAATVVEIHVGYATGLDYFLFEHREKPDETVVVFDSLPWGPLGDGEYGAPRSTLGRLREEWTIRAAFPHAAQTVVN